MISFDLITVKSVLQNLDIYVIFSHFFVYDRILHICMWALEDIPPNILWYLCTSLTLPAMKTQASSMQTKYPAISVYCLATGTYTGIRWYKEKRKIYRQFCGNTFSASEFSNVEALSLCHFFSFLSLPKEFLFKWDFLSANL